MPKKTSQSYIPTVTACCIGYISEAVVNNFLPLLFLIFQSNLGISLERLALLVTVSSRSTSYLQSSSTAWATAAV